MAIPDMHISLFFHFTEVLTFCCTNPDVCLDCGSPPTQGGTASTPKGTTYGEVAIISCNDGYTLNGTSFITCEANGNWSTLPKCIIKGKYNEINVYYAELKQTINANISV
jgi:hypothetical protein